MNTRRIAPVIVFVAITLALTACGSHDAELAEAELSPVAVTLATVERSADARSIEVRGTVQPTRQASL